jgi:protein transport protein SEC20
MSFQSVSDQLAILQESNAQLKDLIDRLANLKFQPGSVPLDDEEGNVITELTVEIQQTLRDQEEDFENLQEDVYDLPDDGLGSESGEQKMDLDATVKRAIKELNLYVSARLYNMGII